MSDQHLPQENGPASTGANPQYGFPPNPGFHYNMQQSLPNSTAVLILGIFSILTCCCYGVIGLLLGFIALVLVRKDRTLYAANAAFYTESSLKNLNAGRVCAIIGVTLNILLIIFMGIMIAIFGLAALTDEKEMLRILENYQ